MVIKTFPQLDPGNDPEGSEIGAFWQNGNLVRLTVEQQSQLAKTHADQILNAFGADMSGQLITGGAGNAYTLSSERNPQVLIDGFSITFRADRANSGAATLDVSGLGSKPLQKQGGESLEAGDLQGGAVYRVTYIETDDVWRLNGVAGGRVASDIAFDPSSAGMLGSPGNVQEAIEAASAISMAKAPPELAWVDGNTITIRAGRCRDESDNINLINPADFNIDLAGAPTNAHRHVLLGYDNNGDPSGIFSEAIALPGGWQAFRRLGSIRTDASGNIRAFDQFGDRFLLRAFVIDVDVVNSGTSASLRTLTVALGVPVVAIFAASQVKISSAISHVFTSVSQTDQAPGIPNSSAPSHGHLIGNSGTSSIAGGYFEVITNVNGSIRSRCSADSSGLLIATFGWIDRRGRDR